VISGSNIHALHKNDSPTVKQKNTDKTVRKIKDNIRHEDIKENEQQENQPLKVRHKL
jgi:hypothetical protein